MVSSMSILCLWDIQLTFDRVGIETLMAHTCIIVNPSLSAVKAYKDLTFFCGSYCDFRSGKVNANGQLYTLYTLYLALGLYCLSSLAPLSITPTHVCKL